MTTFDETIQSLTRDLSDAEADIQAALYSLKTRATDIKIVTHQRRDRPNEQGRPGFFRQELGIVQHIEVVQARADTEHTTTSLNHKNWASVINAVVEISSGCVEDGNKIALRVDSIKRALRTMHLLQQHLAATARVLPTPPEPKRPEQPSAPPETPDRGPPSAASVLLNFDMPTTLSGPAPLEYSLEELTGIHFAEDDAELRAAGEPDAPPEGEDRSMSEELEDEDDDAGD